MDQANSLRNLIQAKENQEIQQTHKTRTARVITITSGKGGVGKSNMALNMAIQFKKMGKKVILMDADFGLANIEVLFGAIPPYSLADVFMGKKEIQDIIYKGPLEIEFISGGSGFSQLANISASQMAYILRSFEYLEHRFDLIIIDTGAGLANSVINFVKASDEVVIVTTPEPTAITDAYAMIKVICEDCNSPLAIKMILNRVENPQEGKRVFEKIYSVCDKFLGIQLQQLGNVPEDSSLVRAVKNQQPVSLAFPDAQVTKAIWQISKTMIERKTEEPSSGILAFMKKLIFTFKD